VRATGTDQQNYQAAFELIPARRYAEGAGFTQFGGFPRAFADDAQYWLAETHFVRSEHSDALQQFRRS
jgi:TolA-binding protein